MPTVVVILIGTWKPLREKFCLGSLPSNTVIQGSRPSLPSCSAGSKSWKERPSPVVLADQAVSSCPQAGGHPGRKAQGAQVTHGFARKSMTPTPPGGACGGAKINAALDWLETGCSGPGIIEVPMAPVEVTEHVFIARTCPICQQRRTPSATLDGVWSWAASGWASTCSA